MPQPRVIIPGFRIGTLNGDAFSLVRARLVETSRNYIIANFPNATKRVSLPITGLMTRKRTEPFPTGSFLPPPLFSFPSLSLFFFFFFLSSTPHFFSSAGSLSQRSLLRAGSYSSISFAHFTVRTF